MNDQELEQLIHEKLRSLPQVPAPPQLMANVLARVQAQSRLVWWKRAIWSWPAPARLMFLVVSLVLLAGLLFGWATVWQWFDVQGFMSAAQESLKGGLNLVTTLAGAGGVLWRAVGQTMFFSVLILVLVSYMLSIGLFSAALRLSRFRI